MKNIYLVKASDSQTLVFTNRNKAVSWLKSSTTWNEDKINSSIVKEERDYRGFFNVWTM